MTPSIYGPFANRKGVTKTAKKMCNDFEQDCFVIEVAPFRYRAYSADHPGEQPDPSLGAVVESFQWTHRPECDHGDAQPCKWDFATGKVKVMRCNDCGETNIL